MMQKFALALMMLVILASPLEAKPRHKWNRHSVVHALNQTPNPAPAKRASVRKPANQFVRYLATVIRELKKVSVGTLDALKTVYAGMRQRLELGTYNDLKVAVDSGRLVRLPGDPRQLNIVLRTSGRDYIGQADKVKGHDKSYYFATQKFVAGAMIEVAANVSSGPIEIPSISRTDEYQGWLVHRIGNNNARTDFPTHAMTLAFDIGLLNSEPETVRETVQALNSLTEQGLLKFIPELNSKCFHVVPLPNAVTHFEDVYDQAAAKVAVAN